MLASDLRALQESYQDIYEEGDGISCEMIEEIVEELIEECVEFGYTIDEATTAVENAAFLFIDEAKVTYGSDTESPEQRRERAKTKVGEKKAAARKAAVKTAVGRVKAKAAGAAAGASIAASVAKDTARRAARTAAHKVSYGAQKKKEQVKSGVKSMIGKGLRKAAGAVGKVAQKAAGAASRLGEEASYSAKAARAGKDIGKPGKAFAKIAKEAGERYGSKERGEKVAGAVLAKLRKEETEIVDEQNQGPSTPVKYDAHMGQLVPNQGAGRVGAVRLKPGMGLKKGGTVKEGSFDIDPAAHRQQQKIQKATELRDRTSGPESGAAGAAIKRMGGSGASLPVQKAHYEPEDIYDLVMEYLLQTQQAETITEAQYVMSQMSMEHIQGIVEAVYGGADPTATAADKRMVVTNADKKGNTPAYQKMMQGNPAYVAAPHLKGV